MPPLISQRDRNAPRPHRRRRPPGREIRGQPYSGPTDNAPCRGWARYDSLRVSLAFLPLPSPFGSSLALPYPECPHPFPCSHSILFYPGFLFSFLHAPPYSAGSAKSPQQAHSILSPAFVISRLGCFACYLISIFTVNRRVFFCENNASLLLLLKFFCTSWMWMRQFFSRFRFVCFIFYKNTGERLAVLRSLETRTRIWAPPHNSSFLSITTLQSILFESFFNFGQMRRWFQEFTNTFVFFFFWTNTSPNPPI